MSILSGFRNYIFGYDIFISYSRKDASTYSSALANILTGKKISCFIDQWGTDPNEDLPSNLKRTLLSSNILILLITDEAVKSKAVANELKLFLSKNKGIVVPINFNSLDKASWNKQIQGLAITNEKAEFLASGQISQEVINRIINTVGHSTKNRRLKKITRGIFVLFLVLLLLSLFLTFQVNSLNDKSETLKYDNIEANKKLDSINSKFTKKEREVEHIMLRLENINQQKTAAIEEGKILNAKNRVLYLNSLANYQLSKDPLKAFGILKKVYEESKQNPPSQSCRILVQASLQTTDSPLYSLNLTHNSPVANAYISKTNQNIITHTNSDVYIWDIEGNMIKKIPYKNFIYSLVSPDKQSVMIRAGAVIDIVDFSGNIIFHKQFKNTIFNAIYSPDSKNILIADKDSLKLFTFEGNLINIFKHPSQINKINFSNDCSLICSTCSTDSTVFIWDKNKNLKHKYIHSTYINNLLFSPYSDKIISVSPNCTAKIFNLQNCELITITHTNAMKDALFSDDEKYLITLSSKKLLDKTAKLWDIKGNFIYDFSNIEDIKFLANSSNVFVALPNKEFRIYNLTDMSYKTISKNIYVSKDVEFSPDGLQLLTYQSNDAFLLDISGKILAKCSHDDFFKNAHFSPDGASFITCSSDHTAKIWNANNKLSIKIDFSNGVHELLKMTDSTFVAYGIEGNIGFYTNKGSLLQEIQDKNGISKLIISPDKSRIICWNKTNIYASVYELNSKIEAKLNHGKPLNEVCISPKGNYLITYGSDTVFKVWNKDLLLIETLNSNVFNNNILGNDPSIKALNITKKTLGIIFKTIINNSLERSYLRNIDFTSDEQFFLIGTKDRIVVCDALGKIISVIHENGRELSFAKFIPSSDKIIAGFTGDYCNVFNIKGDVVYKIEDSNIWDCDFSKNGKYIVTRGGDKKIKLWNKNGNCIAEFNNHKNNIRGLLFSNSSDCIVSWAEDFTLKIWGLSGKELASVKHEDLIKGAVLNLKSNRILSFTTNKIKLWNLNGELLGEYFYPSSNIKGAFFSNCDQKIIGWTSNNIFIWQTPESLFLWLKTSDIQNFSEDEFVDY